MQAFGLKLAAVISIDGGLRDESQVDLWMAVALCSVTAEAATRLHKRSRTIRAKRFHSVEITSLLRTLDALKKELGAGKVDDELAIGVVGGTSSAFRSGRKGGHRSRRCFVLLREKVEVGFLDFLGMRAYLRV